MQKTIIQLTTEVPYIDLFTYDFLYVPISSILWINGNKHFVDEMYDKIEENGDITRRIRVRKMRTNN